jgi:hypothetical protein
MAAAAPLKAAAALRMLAARTRKMIPTMPQTKREP